MERAGTAGCRRHRRGLRDRLRARAQARWPALYCAGVEGDRSRTGAGFDTLDLTVDLLVTPDLTRWEWKDEDLRREAL